MTKLMQWLCGVVMLVAVWLGLLTEAVPFHLSQPAKEVVFASPIYLLILFACYSLAVIGYRVAIFNDCSEASQELRQEIVDAKEDLARKGLKLT